MARSGKHHQIHVHERIIAALEEARQKANKTAFKPISMNGFCQQILWDFAMGKLIPSDPPVIKDVEKMAGEGTKTEPEIPEGDLKGAAFRKRRSLPKSA